MTGACRHPCWPSPTPRCRPASARSDARRTCVCSCRYCLAGFQGCTRIVVAENPPLPPAAPPAVAVVPLEAPAPAPDAAALTRLVCAIVAAGMQACAKGCFQFSRRGVLMGAQPFEIRVSSQVLDDLNQRLENTRWADEVEDNDWEHGTNRAYL